MIVKDGKGAIHQDVIECDILTGYIRHLVRNWDGRYAVSTNGAYIWESKFLTPPLTPIPITGDVYTSVPH